MIAHHVGHSVQFLFQLSCQQNALSILYCHCPVGVFLWDVRPVEGNLSKLPAKLTELGVSSGSCNDLIAQGSRLLDNFLAASSA